MKHFYKKTIFIIAVFFYSTILFSQDFSQGVLILNEGNFGTDNASVSYLDNMSVLSNNVFSTQNGNTDLGNTAQGLGLNGSFAYIVLNGSNAIRVVNRTSFELVTTITDQMSNPRYIAFSDGKAYVTNWGDGTNSSDDYVAVIDLSNNTVIDTISVIEGPEEIVEKNGTLFVAHQGGFSQGTTVSAIDTSNNSVQSIDVGDVPSALKVDDNNLYVLCSGNPSFTGNETPGSLFIIGLSDYTNIKEFNFPGLEHPAFLGLDATDLYYTLNSNIFKMAISDTELPTVPFIDTATQSVSTPYSFNKINNQLYLGDAIDFVSDGTVFVYGEDGIFDTQYTVGPLPNGFYDTTENSLSLSNFSQPSVKLFPNPTKGSFNIDTNEVVDILIFDISGRVVNRNQYSGQPVSLKGLNPGIYIVQMTINNNKTTQKLILE